MRIGSIIQSLNTENVKKLEQSKKDVEKTSKTARNDSSIISKDAKRLSETTSDISIVKARASHEPDVRIEKVQEVREKIKSGYYNSSEFADKLAEKIIKDFNI
jgi:negative regulator of flagellin synthesis FlgM